MYQCWTLLLFVTMHVQSSLTAVATFPKVSSGMQLSKHVQSTAKEETSKTFSTNWPDEVQLGCKELRAKRFISDGFCTSLKPLKEVVCAGQCMPIKEQNMPWWAEFTKYWANPKFMEWRCVEAVTKLKKVQLMCENGETRTYRIRVVKSCRCKSYEKGTNVTDLKTKSPPRGKRDKDETKRKRKQRKEQKRTERRRKRLERKRAKKQERKRLGQSSKHRHSGDRDSRRSRRQHSGDIDTVKGSQNKNETVSDSQNRNLQLLKNESPTV
ncbi:sclerostin domain-containing protein 1-like [Mercenaria mercenaria]|uniref:sclerostin domain-containing protein 1-like n=1 Tax=Mercenaria mercenaria TaxID=6596 RepID=UPI00234F8826|nr:sclerostin domain-containing protein 1-like [Mercenaria mercenaria]